MYQLKVTLADVKPPVWRRIRVRGDLSLERLHVVLQRTLGWRDEHLHEWIVGGRRYGIPEPDEPEYEVEDERRLTLREAGPIPGARFEYVYDLGDGWRLRHPECLAGQGACPPENCGGPPSYTEFLEVINDPGHAEHEDRRIWAGGRFDPEAFDLAAVNRKLRRLK